MSSLSLSLVSPVRSHSFAAPEPAEPRDTERSFTMKTLFEGLESELARLGLVYARRQLEHPAFAAYPTLPGLIERLTHGAKEEREIRSSLVCAILEVHRKSPHRLWVALLLRAFRPMLRKTWKKLFGAAPDERLALLITSFQETILRVDPTRDPVRIAMYVRQGTRKRVFAKLARELDWETVGFGPDVDLEPDPRTLEGPPVAGAWLRGHRLPKGAQVDGDLVGTLGHHGALLALVRRKHPTATQQEQARIYSTLRDRRRRMVTKMRGHLKREVAKLNPSIAPRDPPLPPTCPNSFPLHEVCTVHSPSARTSPCPTPCE
jgi:hypothetical protein